MVRIWFLVAYFLDLSSKIDSRWNINYPVSKDTLHYAHMKLKEIHVTWMRV